MKKIFTLFFLLWGFCAFAGTQIEALTPAPISMSDDLAKVPDYRESIVANKNAPLPVINTRGTESPSCYMAGSIFQEEEIMDRSKEMQLNSDGTFTLTPGITYPGNLYFIYYPEGRGEPAKHLYSESPYWEKGIPFEVSQQAKSYIQFDHRGEYTFTFDPATSQVTIVGETLPFEYYLSGYFNDNLQGDPDYKFTPLNDGSGNYTLSFKGRLVNYFIIDTGSLYLYYGGNGSVLEPGEKYQTSQNSGDYIPIIDGYDIVDPVLTFNPETEELIVEGTLEEPEYSYWIEATFLNPMEDAWMEEQPDGTFVFDPQHETEAGNFYIQQYNKRTGTLVGKITAAYLENMKEGEPMPCKYNDGYRFFVYGGTYKFIYDPVNFTVTIEGEKSPETFYLVSYGADAVYQLEESEGNYIIEGLPFLMSGYIVESSWGRRFLSNGEQLIPGELYQTSPDYWLIDTEDNLTLFDVNVTFNPENATLLIEASDALPPVTAYVLYGDIFKEDGGLATYPLKEIEGRFTTDAPVDVFQGEFVVVKYDENIGLSNYYRFYGADYDYYPVDLGRPMHCYEGASDSFLIEEGQYSFLYDPVSQSLIVSTPETVLPDAFLAINAYGVWSNYVEPTVRVINVNLPEGEVDYKVYYRISSDEEYISKDVTLNENHTFVMTINDLRPDSNYISDIYLSGIKDDKVYNSEIYEFSYFTNPIQLWLTWQDYKVTDTTFEGCLLITGNFEDVDNFDVYYAVLPRGTEVTESDLTYMDSGDLPNFYFTNLTPSTDYTLWVKVDTTINGVQGTTGLSYLNFTTGSEAGVSMIGDNESQPVYYDLNGRKVVHPSNGLFIEVKGNSVRKIFIR